MDLWCVACFTDFLLQTLQVKCSHWEIEMEDRESFGLDTDPAKWKTKEEGTQSINVDFIDLWKGNERYLDKD